MDSNGKAAVVTGSGRGIGRRIAERLAADGVSVVIADRDPALGAEAVSAIEAAGGRALFHRTDVAERDSVRGAIAACTEAFGSFDLMLNNAGFNKPEPFLEATEANWRAIMDVNALGVMIGIQEAGKAMIAAGTRGKIVNTASIAGRTGFPDFAPYSVSKAAVTILTQAGARSLAPHGITVNAFAPGVVETPLWEQLDKELYAMGASKAPGEAMQAMADGILLGRVATPDDVVGTVLFLCSAASDYMTGQVVAIDGGMIL